MGDFLVNYVGNHLGEYAVPFGLALVVLTGAFAALIVSRRRYVRSADLKRAIEALRLDFRRSIEETRATAGRKTTAVRENLFSVIKTIDSTLADLAARLARLEEHADAVDTFMTGPQRQALEANEQIAARLTKLEQRLKAVTDELSLVEQTIDGATVRDRDRNDSIEAMNSRLINTQKQVDELFPRLELGERARIDLGTLIGLFVKQLKRVNLNSAETALRVADLESLRSKVTGLEERLTSAVLGKDYGSTGDFAGDINDVVTDTTPKTGDGAGLFEASNGSGNAGVAEESPTSTEEASNEPNVEGERVSGSRPETGVTNELH